MGSMNKMLPANDLQTDNPSRVTTFDGKAALHGYIATVITLAAIGVLVLWISDVLGVALLPQDQPSASTTTVGFLTLLFSLMAAWFWRLYAIRKRPLLRLGREGIEVNLGVAIIKSFPMRMLTAFGLLRARFGWIPWYQLRRVEARPSVSEYHAKAGSTGGLVLEGSVLMMHANGPNPTGVALAESLAILTSEFQSTPTQVAAKIQPYLDDPQLRQTLPSLFGS